MVYCTHQQIISPLKKRSNLYQNGTKHYYRGSEATSTDHYHCDKETEQTEDKEYYYNKKGILVY